MMIATPLRGPDALAGVPYGDHPAQKADLRLPATPRAAVVCLLHGGYWRPPFGREQMGPLARELVARGYAVWNAGYRRIGEGGGFPGSLDDAALAVDHLAELATLGVDIDLGRVVIAGHSVGAQLALVCASRLESRVRAVAVAAIDGVLDLHDALARGIGDGAVAAYAGGGPVKHPQAYARSSPLRLLPLGACQVVIHGSNNEEVSVATARRYVAAARQAGDRVMFAEIPGGDHADGLNPATRTQAAFIRALERILGPATDGAPHHDPASAGAWID